MEWNVMVHLDFKEGARRLAFQMKARTILSSSHQIAHRLEIGENDPREIVAARQRRIAVAHARFAMENTEFYRQKYSEAGLKVEDFDDPDVFESLPIVEKSDVRERFDDFCSSEASQRTSVRSLTGGSTGEPLHLLRDKRVSAQPLEWTLYRWWGISPHDNIALVARHVKTDRERRVHAAKWWPSERMQLDAYEVNNDTVRRFAEQWEAVKPSLLTGYAGGILEVARSLTRLGLEVSAPAAIATTASPLSPEHRKEIGSALGAPVFDHYRSSEIPWMGGECREQAGHHIFSDQRVIEIVDVDNTPVRGEYGQVVASDLTNRVFPLIRYRLGDRSRTIEQLCPCGVTLPRIDRVVGKVGDGLRLPDGTWMAAEGVLTMFSDIPQAVTQFQVHQSADASIKISCIVGDGTDAVQLIESTVDRLRDRVGGQVPVTWSAVQEISHDGGKIRYVKSDIV